VIKVFYSSPSARNRASGQIPTENWYAADETGVALGQTQKTEVIGPTGQQSQKVQTHADREIVTVMEIKKWGKENPCEAA